MHVWDDYHFGLEAIDFYGAFERTVAIRHLIKFQVLYEVAVILDIFQLLLSLLLLLLAHLKLLLPIVDIAFFIVLLLGLIWNKDRIIAAKRRCLILQIFLHKLGPEVLVRFELLLIFLLLHLLLQVAVVADHLCLLIDLHSISVFVAFTLTLLLTLRVHLNMQLISWIKLRVLK